MAGRAGRGGRVRVRAAAGGRATADMAVETGFHEWNAPSGRHRVRFQAAGPRESGVPRVLLVHGFGGNCEHWRKNIAALAEGGRRRVLSVDLLGYGYSEKPSPKGKPLNSIYNFENWAQQLNSLLDFDLRGPEDGTAAPSSSSPSEGGQREQVILVANSVGCVAALQAAKDLPGRVQGVACLNPSLRMLHVDKQPAMSRPFVSAFQTLLRETPVGGFFFSQIAKEQAVENVLKEAYHDPATVTKELVDAILRPALEPGALEVFLDFISYSGGPLPERLIPQMDCPVLLVWGEEDPWEPVKEGAKWAAFPTVEDFVRLPGVGHCPQDEAPQLVNPVLDDFITKHTEAPAQAAAAQL